MTNTYTKIHCYRLTTSNNEVRKTQIFFRKTQIFIYSKKSTDILYFNIHTRKILIGSVGWPSSARAAVTRSARPRRARAGTSCSNLPRGLECVHILGRRALSTPHCLATTSTQQSLIKTRQKYLDNISLFSN